MTSVPHQTSPSEPVARDARVLAALVLVGVLNALWALFLWTELVRSRSGAEVFCGFGGSDCGALWNADFAAAVHDVTGLPVAAWGLVWSLAALTLPLLALAAEAGQRPGSALRSAVVLTGVGGVAGLVVLLAASAAAGMFCSSCALTYLLTLGYAGGAFLLRRHGAGGHGLREIGMAVGAVLAAWLALLYPGLQTPKNAAREGQKILAAVASEPPAGAETPPAAPPRAPAPAPSPPAHPTPTVPEEEPSPPPLGDADDGRLEELLGQLQPPMLQALSDTLRIYRDGLRLPMEPPRSLLGEASAPVRIIEFTDALCSHCATLHGTLSYLRAILPPTAFSIDSRHFPLDGNCNPYLEVRGPESVRCLAARAQICMEDTPDAFEFAGALLDNQQRLTPELVYDLAAPYLSRAELEYCVGRAETASKLRADVDYAWRYEPDGTPLVLVNGRHATAFGPFLYAIILTGGSPDHPAFDVLPPPDRNAHVH